MHGGRIAGLLLAAGLVYAASAAAAGAPVVSDEYENLDAEHALANVPVTFSRIGAAGDFTGGVTPVIDGARLPAQVRIAVQSRTSLAGALWLGLAGKLAIRLSGKRSLAGSYLPPNSSRATGASQGYLANS